MSDFSTGYSTGGLGTRLGRLEQSRQQSGQTSDGPTEWRAYLMRYFADARYDAHRDALIAALCAEDGRVPRYELLERDSEGNDQRRELIIWAGRGHGGPPIIVRYVDDWPGMGGASGSSGSNGRGVARLFADGLAW